jgi:hypothetical protein
MGTTATVTTTGTTAGPPPGRTSRAAAPVSSKGCVGPAVSSTARPTTRYVAQPPSTPWTTSRRQARKHRPCKRVDVSHVMSTRRVAVRARRLHDEPNESQSLAAHSLTSTVLGKPYPSWKRTACGKVRAAWGPCVRHSPGTGPGSDGHAPANGARTRCRTAGRQVCACRRIRRPSLPICGFGVHTSRYRDQRREPRPVPWCSPRQGGATLLYCNSVHLCSCTVLADLLHPLPDRPSAVQQRHSSGHQCHHPGVLRGHATR